MGKRMEKLRAKVASLTNGQIVATIAVSVLVPVEGYVAIAPIPEPLKGLILAEVGVAIALISVLFGVNPVPPVPTP